MRDPTKETVMNRPTAPTRRRAAAALAAVALAATGCGSNDPDVAGVSSEAGHGTGHSSRTAEVAGVDPAHNDADLAFIAEMTPHHGGAVEMSGLAETRAASPQVKALALRIAQAQGPEIEQMEKMAAAWGTDVDQAGGHGSHAAGDAAALAPLQGEAFDREFLIRMIAHHESALPMSRTVLTAGENPQAKQLAEQIIRTQQAEIAEMKALLAQL